MIDLLSRSAPLILQGAAMTILLAFLSAALSFALGLLFGIFSCSQLKVRFVSPLIEGICFVLRGIPFFVQLLLVYFVVPDLFGLNLDPLPASVIALGTCSSGYVAQFVRGTLNAIPISQWEAAYSLGYRIPKALHRIILPQLFRRILPMLNNELEALLKSTAIVSSIGLLELTRVGMNIVSREMEPLPIYLTLACLYLSMSAVLNLLHKYLEKRFSYVTY